MKQNDVNEAALTLALTVEGKVLATYEAYLMDYAQESHPYPPISKPQWDALLDWKGIKPLMPTGVVINRVRAVKRRVKAFNKTEQMELFV